jgi:hypothetical protein
VYGTFSLIPFLISYQSIGNLKDHFIKTSSQTINQIKSNGKLNEHTISQSAKKPMVERRLTRNMEGKVSATFYVTWTISHNHCEKNQSTKETYQCEEENDQLCKNL